MVSDCYDDLPMFALGSRELEELTVSAVEESTRRCCDPVDEALTDKHFVNKYGLKVATDILVAHKRDGNKLMQQKAHYVDLIWATTVRDELYALGVNANQPQDEQEVVAMLNVRDQLVLMMNTELHLVQESASEIDQRPHRERFPQ